MRLPDEYDACGLVALVERGTPTHENLQETLRILVHLSHRAGSIDGEGDGSGVLTDLPVELWAQRLGVAPTTLRGTGFFVGHFFLPQAGQDWSRRVTEVLAAAGAQILWSEAGLTDSGALGPRARRDEPLFWQIAGRLPGREPDRRLFELGVELEGQLPIHLLSLSRHTAVYKVMGSASSLGSYFGDLQDPLFRTRTAIGHNRYSTNTAANFHRVQPFSRVAHNGEINTVHRLQEEARLLGVPLVEGASDSQDLNRVLGALLHRFDLDLAEALEMLFPPILNEMHRMPGELQDLFVFYRHAFGPLAQGPAAILAREGAWLGASVDALGLRPLWLLETPGRILLSSEQGVVPTRELTVEPRPLAPGEKLVIRLDGGEVCLLDQPAVEQHCLARARERGLPLEGGRRYLRAAFPPPGAEAVGAGSPAAHAMPPLPPPGELERLQALFGFSDDDLDVLEAMVQTGNEPIGSLGYDGPLAALSREPVNLADFFKESVAVVTNPAIDREREIEHFSTRTLLGARPLPDGRGRGPLVELRIPLVLPEGAGPDPDRWHRAAVQWGTLTEAGLERAVRSAGGRTVRLPFGLGPGQGVRRCLDALARQAVREARGGAALLILDDRTRVPGEAAPLDPHLVLAWVDRALRQARRGEASLRRQVGLVLASGALRNLHDVMLALTLGADAVVPYLLWAAAATAPEGPANLLGALQKGMEKVISTIGIHELRGYHRLVSAIGLDRELAGIFDVPAFAGGEASGRGLEGVARDALARWEEYRASQKTRPGRTYHIYPKLWKLAAQAAAGAEPYQAYEARVRELELEQPVSLRHLLDVRTPEPTPEGLPHPAVLAVGRHALPFVISSMSFGSQNEVAYRAYAEAAYRLNILAFNGEGGEIPDLIGRYPENRGIQLASGRFGVNVEMVNGARYLEIKIGQGAKPGEGGHLPGTKVSAKVAAARRARPGVDLISPSNNHDLYSIEDLAQFIEELKTTNPRVHVGVKVPVVPGIGTIAVGIAKAGADMVVLSGFDGGTGAARRHALRHVGLPVEVGVRLAHRALVEAGIRDRVELWADGGLKSAQDVLKLILMGANRVGFGTLSMVAIGCTICRGCQLDSCHVGIATQVEDEAEAHLRGLKRFVPRQLEPAVAHLVTFFTGMAQELARLTAALGAGTLQELVGRSDLLVQARGRELVDLTELVEPVLPVPGPLPFSVREREPAVAAGAVRRNVRTLANGRSLQLTEAVRSGFAAGQAHVELETASVTCSDRVLGSHLAGSLAREHIFGSNGHARQVSLLFNHGSVAGNGFASFNRDGLTLRIHGGAQDGTAKSASGGRVVVLKVRNDQGQWVGGSVGKSFAYGAQQGLLIVQGDADSRFCIRLSGADVVAAGRPHGPAARGAGIAARANLKGFAFEYMTNGRALVLGDPGPWICSGMTGGVVYLHLQPELGLVEEAFRERLAKGAKVRLVPAGAADLANLRDLLGSYHEELVLSGQEEEAARILTLMEDPLPRFLKAVPLAGQTDPDVSTE
ncbi:glutamate synthase-related protein [Limnochorda pilosa]|uniref:Glutamate synthase n=1 Tax=Limnochorda pilosa TaxID=1555112 RepID=A0A0K2SK92_LIMPI|nr:glutamate synthase-related protein [Limnochorda pilosa]BAS27249.1 glutamate synthase [Limnochorda pilosa]